MKYNEITDPKIIEVLDAFRTYLGSYDEDTKGYYKETNEWIDEKFWDCEVKADNIIEAYEVIRTIYLVIDGDEGGPNVIIANFSQPYDNLNDWVLEQATQIFDTMWAEFAHRDPHNNGKLVVLNISTEKFE